MTPDDAEAQTPPAVDKGKRRAHDPTERTPLLQDTSYGASSAERIIAYTSPPTSHSRLRSILATVFLTSLFLCLILAVFLTILAWSYASKASGLSPDEILNKDVALSGPFHVDLLNTTDDGGLWLNVSGRMGFDAGDVIGVNHRYTESEGLLEGLWKAIGRWGIRQLDTVTVNLTTAVHIAPEFDSSLVLMTVLVPPLMVPLTVDPPKREVEWLTPVTMEVLVRPTRNATTLTRFMVEAWKRGRFGVKAYVEEVVVRGGVEGSWKANFYGRMKNIRTSIGVKIPSLPGLPMPGKHTPFPSVSDFLTLKVFRISNQHSLTIYAESSIINPFTEDFHISLPSLPFTVSLPNGTTPSDSRVLVANVISHPCEFTHPNITLYLSGTVPSLPRSSFPILSTFLSRYLNTQPNPILISSPLLTDPLNPSSPIIEIPAEFPAPSERPKLLRNVTIKEMKIRPSVGTNGFLASGTVFANVVLPKGIDVDVDVFKVFPDVLVFDGEVPLKEEGLLITTPPTMPDLPDPLPEHAFGHIRPDDWLPSTSVRLENEEEDGDDEERKTGAVYAVSAKVVDVPLEVLPGRQGEFSNFVGKVIFGSGGAVAGIQGFAAVKLEVNGLPLGPGRNGEEGNGAMLELIGLPFRGSVRVGRKGL